MSKQKEEQGRSKYNVTIDRAQGMSIGDNAQVTNNNFYVAEPPDSHPISTTTPVPPITREDLLRRIRVANTELRDYPHDIAGEHLKRPEVEEILGWIMNASPNEKLGMILDQPGGGKTVVTRDVLEGLENAGVSVLAIKADALSGVEDANGLRQRLGLPMSIEDCAHYLTGEGLFAVIVDQIDALSMVLSRDQTTLDAILSAISRLSAIPNVRIVASCRTFDVRHDPRLSSIKIDREFELGALTEDQINSVLHCIGIEPTRLLPEHKALLTVPLHLHLYAQVMTGASERQSRESFRTLQELYDALWRRIIEAVPPASPSPDERIRAIYELVDVMRQRSQLTAPYAVLDRHGASAHYLEQIGFIKREQGNYLFSHQTLFDYCYARRFVASGKSLSSEIFSGEQGLFERSQMIHVLAYLRGADETIYRRELSALMFTDRLRIHLRLLLMNWFGSLTKPTQGEVRIAQRLMSTPEGCVQFLSSAAGNEEWFDALDAGIMERLFRLDDQRTVNAFYWFLSSVIEKRTREVVVLLRPYLGRNPEMNSHIAFVLDRLSKWESEEALDLLCNLFQQRGSTTGREYFLSLHHLASSNPAGGCRAVRVLLDRRVDELLEAERRDFAESDAPGGGDNDNAPSRSLGRSRFHWNEYLFSDHSVSEVINKTATVCPEKIIEHLLPWFLRVTELLTVKEIEIGEAEDAGRESYPWDALFSSGWYDDYMNESAILVRRIIEALQHMALNQPETFRRLVQSLSSIDSLAVHRALANAYLASPEAYAPDIFEYLTEDKRRLYLGEMDEGEYDSRILLGAAFEFMNNEQRARLENLVLSLEPAWESRSPDYDFRGQTQLKFLKSITKDELLSETAHRVLRELEEKLPNLKIEAPTGIIIRDAEPSPISEEILATMSNDELLDAMRKYNDTYRSAEGEEPFARGTAVSPAIAALAGKEPERYYRLALQFDDTISFDYLLVIISQLSQSKAVPAEWLFDLVERFASRIAPSHRQAISHALHARAEEHVPDDLLDMMEDWALHDPDPARDSRDEVDNYGNKHHGGDPFNQGLNTTRGMAVAYASRSALVSEPQRVERAFSLLEEAANDPTTAVRSRVIEALNWMVNRGEDSRALDIFDRAVDGHPKLLQLPVVHRFLHRTYFRHFERIRPFIEGLFINDDGNTRQMGAALACLAAFEYEEAGDLEARAMSGDEMMRCGAAQVYARQIGNPKLESTCRERLLTLMQDKDENVLASVGGCFQHACLEHFEGLRSFIEEFIHSPALLPGAKHLVSYFKQLAADEHDLTLRVTERILDEGGDELFNMGKNRLLTDSDLVVLPMTVYTHAHDPAVKNRAIELFERLLSKGSYAAQQALNDWDRR